MKRYKLKKDLPTHKTGAKFRMSQNGNLVDKSGVVYYKATLDRYPTILTEWFEEIPEQPKTVWDLKMSQTYYYITENDYVNVRLWKDEEVNFRRRNSGNCFLTEEEAKKELARRRAKVILERDTKGFKPDWEGSGLKHEVYYNYSERRLKVYSYFIASSHRELWFATEEDAEASIRAHEKEWKIYLGVE